TGYTSASRGDGRDHRGRRELSRAVDGDHSGGAMAGSEGALRGAVARSGGVGDGANGSVVGGDPAGPGKGLVDGGAPTGRPLRDGGGRPCRGRCGERWLL